MPLRMLPTIARVEHGQRSIFIVCIVDEGGILMIEQIDEFTKAHQNIVEKVPLLKVKTNLCSFCVLCARRP